MRRVALVVFAVTACTDWEGALAKKLASFDAGSVTQDSGPDDAGPPDAGIDAGVDAGVDAGAPDAGPPDAGPCTGAVPCLRQVIQLGLNEVNWADPIGNGQYLAAGRTGVTQQLGQRLFTDGGPYAVQQFPDVTDALSTSDQMRYPVMIAARGANYAVADYYGYAMIGAGNTTIASTDKCGFTAYQRFYKLTWADDDTVYFPSTGYNDVLDAGAHVCRWKRDAGFTGIDLGAMTTPPTEDPLRAAFSLPSGELFFGGNAGALIYWKPPDSPVLWRHPDGGAIWAIHGSAIDNVWAAGDYGTIARFNSDDAGWTVIQQPSITVTPTSVFYFNGIWARATDDVWFAASFAHVYRYSGGTFQRVMLDRVTFVQQQHWTYVKSIASPNPQELALAATRVFIDGGVEGELLIYERP